MDCVLIFLSIEGIIFQINVEFVFLQEFQRNIEIMVKTPKDKKVL